MAVRIGEMLRSAAGEDHDYGIHAKNNWDYKVITLSGWISFHTVMYGGAPVHGCESAILDNLQEIFGYFKKLFHAL